MKIILTVFATLFVMATSVQAADVVCSCSGETKCSDVKITFVPSNPGVYMTIEYAYGERNLEGFASIRRDSKEKRVIYTLGNFLLVEQDNKFSLPNKAAQCN